MFSTYKSVPVINIFLVTTKSPIMATFSYHMATHFIHTSQIIHISCTLVTGSTFCPSASGSASSS